MREPLERLEPARKEEEGLAEDLVADPADGLFTGVTRDSDDERDDRDADDRDADDRDERNADDLDADERDVDPRNDDGLETL